MKNLFKFFGIAIIFVALGANAFSQVTATATAAAQIVTPLTITKSADMNFGKIAVGASGGTVVLSPNGNTGVTGDCLTQGGTVSVATFSITGQAAQTYAVTLPTTVTLNDGSGHSMTVDTFTSDRTGALPETLHVGATLNVSGAQAGGTYTSAPFNVSVNYN